MYAHLHYADIMFIYTEKLIWKNVLTHFIYFLLFTSYLFIYVQTYRGTQHGELLYDVGIALHAQSISRFMPATHSV